MIYIQVNGKTGKKMDKAHIYLIQQGWNSSDPLEQDKLFSENGCILMDHFSKVALKIIFRKEKENGVSKMETQLKEFTIKQKE